jgi:hypothetical protein
MFRAIPLSIIRSLFTVHSVLVYVIHVRRQLSNRSICSCSKAVYEHVWHIPIPSVQWINSWWWTEELPETCWVSCQNKFGKLVHLFGFIIKKVKVFYKVIVTKVKAGSEPICTKHIYSLHCLSVFPTEFHENPTDKSVADANWRRGSAWTWSPHKAFFFLPFKERVINFAYWQEILTPGCAMNCSRIIINDKCGSNIRAVLIWSCWRFLDKTLNCDTVLV